jgi:GNAT superfamily N-acetyltransferase
MVRLRKAGAGDIKLVRAILAAVAADLATRFGPGHWSTVRSAESLRKYASSGVLYVVEADALAVGTLHLTTRKIGFYKEDWFKGRPGPVGYLLDMAVHPSHQRRGIGRHSMELVEGLARLAGLRAIRLDAYRGPAGAGEFYKKCGYASVHKGEMRGVALEYFEKSLPRSDLTAGLKAR